MVPFPTLNFGAKKVFSKEDTIAASTITISNNFKHKKIATKADNSRQHRNNSI